MIIKRNYKDKYILAIKPYSEHISDKYLQIVLAYLPFNKYTPYVTWLFNDSDGGFHEGNYHRFIKDAMEEFMLRGYLKYNDSFINCYNGIEAHYCVYIDKNTVNQFCEAEAAQLISVYLHRPEGGIDCITDHFDGKDAMRIIRYIQNKYSCIENNYFPNEICTTKLKPIIF